MLREESRDRKPPPASFLTDADKEKHKDERLKKGERIGPEWSIKARVKQHRDTESGHGHENGESQRKSVPARMNAEANKPGEKFPGAYFSAKQSSRDKGCREHSQGIHARSAGH